MEEHITVEVVQVEDDDTSTPQHEEYRLKVPELRYKTRSEAEYAARKLQKAIWEIQEVNK